MTMASASGTPKRGVQIRVIYGINPGPWDPCAILIIVTGLPINCGK